MRISSRGWRAPLLAAAVGFTVLGIGGRLAMRTTDTFTDAASAMRVEGTITVWLAGTGPGVAGPLSSARGASVAA